MFRRKTVNLWITIVGNILTMCQEDGSKVDTSFSKLYQTQNNWMELMVFRCLKNWNWDQKIFLFTWGIYKGGKQPCIEESCRWKAGWREISTKKDNVKKTYQNKEYVELQWPVTLKWYEEDPGSKAASGFGETCWYKCMVFYWMETTLWYAEHKEW